MNNLKPEEKKFWSIKKEIRILGIDDGPFTPQSNEKTLLVGALFRAGHWLDGVLSTHIQVDGNDATSQIGDMVLNSRHLNQLGVLMLDGVTFGGFNVVNIRKLYKKTGVPVIVITRKNPNFKGIKEALKKFPDWQNRWNDIIEAGEVIEITQNEPIYMQYMGLSQKNAEEIVKLSTTRSAIPEPIRAAHIIASGIVTGESKGSA